MADHFGPIRGHGFLAWIEGDDGLAAIDTDWDLARGEPWEGSSLQALAHASEATGKPLTHVLLTHDHVDHVSNLPMILQRWPEARVLAHANSSVEAVTDRLQGGERLETGGHKIEVLYTPGHSAARDELSYYLPALRFLFSGDLAQPQGPSYSHATGPAPVPYFHDGGAYRSTLERLIALDPQYMRTGHGDFLGPEQTRQWLRVTLATVTRIEALALELAERYPDRDNAWLAGSIYDQIVEERHFGFAAGNRRKRGSTYPGATDYERFDLPGILWAVEQARAIV